MPYTNNFQNNKTFQKTQKICINKNLNHCKFKKYIKKIPNYQKNSKSPQKYQIFTRNYKVNQI